MAEVAAPLGLGRVQRRVQTHGHERVLQRRTRARMRVHVAGRNARDAEPSAETRQPPVACPVVAQERSLELDPQTIGPERVEQSPERELVVHAPQRAPAQADQALGVVEHVRQLDERLRRRSRLLARVGMRPGQDPAEIRPAVRVLHEQRQMAPVRQVDLCPVDRPQPERACGDCELHRSRDRCCGRSARAPDSRARSAAGASSSGSDAPSRNEKAEWQWSSTYIRTHVRKRIGRHLGTKSLDILISCC